MKYKILLKDRTHRKSKTQLTQGAFGNCHNFDNSNYKTLKIIPKSKRTPKNSNKLGVSND